MCDAVEFVGIGSDVVQLVRGPARAGKPTRPGRQRPGLPGRPKLTRDRDAVGVGRKIVAVDPWQKVADVSKPLIPYRPAEARRTVHTVAGSNHDVAGRGEGPQERTALHAVGNGDAGELEHGRPEIHEAHECARPATGLLAVGKSCPRREPLRHVDQERHTQAMFGERPFAMRNALAMIAPEKDDRVVGEPVRRELVEEFSDLRVEARGEFQPLSKGLPYAGRVGKVRRYDDIAHVAACFRRKGPSHLRGLVAEQSTLVRDV